MRKSEIDDLLTTMLESHDNVSDLNVTVDRPLQVESSGELVGVPVDPAIDSLTPFQSEIFALNLINNDRRLSEHLLRQGSCDSVKKIRAAPGRAVRLGQHQRNLETGIEQGAVHEIFQVKRLVLSLRRHLSPQREVFNVLSNRPTPLLAPEAPATTG